MIFTYSDRGHSVVLLLLLILYMCVCVLFVTPSSFALFFCLISPPPPPSCTLLRFFFYVVIFRSCLKVSSKRNFRSFFVFLYRSLWVTRSLRILHYIHACLVRRTKVMVRVLISQKQYYSAAVDPLSITILSCAKVRKYLIVYTFLYVYYFDCICLCCLFSRCFFSSFLPPSFKSMFIF